MTPRQTADPDSNITSAASSVESDGDLDYFKSHKNSPMILANMPEIKGKIQELQQMHKVAEVDLKEITQPIELFTQPNKLDPMELADDETFPAENHQDNDNMSSHVTQPSLLYSPLKDSLVTLEPLPLHPCVDSGDIIRLASTSDQPKVGCKSDGNALFGVYQD